MIVCLEQSAGETAVCARFLTIRGFSAGSYSASWLDVLVRRMGLPGVTVVGAVAMPADRSYCAIHALGDNLCFWKDLNDLADLHVVVLLLW